LDDLSSMTEDRRVVAVLLGIVSSNR